MSAPITLTFAKTGAVYVARTETPLDRMADAAPFHEALGVAPATPDCLQCGAVALGVLIFGLLFYGLVFGIGWWIIRPAAARR